MAALLAFMTVAHLFLLICIKFGVSVLGFEFLGFISKVWLNFRVLVLRFESLWLVWGFGFVLGFGVSFRIFNPSLGFEFTS